MHSREQQSHMLQPRHPATTWSLCMWLICQWMSHSRLTTSTSGWRLAAVQPFSMIPVLEDPELGIPIFESRSIVRCASPQLHRCHG
jgi:glutathione S-transferase